MPADTDTADVTVYVIVWPERATDPAPIPKLRLIAGVPARPAPETAMVIVLIVPAVAVLNEYAYVTAVALIWLFETDQLTFVNAAAPAGATGSTSVASTIPIARSKPLQRPRPAAELRLRTRVGRGRVEG